MMIGNIGRMQYRMRLQQIKKRMQDGKVKPIKPTDNNGDLNSEKHKESNKKKQAEQ